MNQSRMNKTQMNKTRKANISTSFDPFSITGWVEIDH
jgi:hypothetical protein